MASSLQARWLAKARLRRNEIVAGAFFRNSSRLLAPSPWRHQAAPASRRASLRPPELQQRRQWVGGVADAVQPVQWGGCILCLSAASFGVLHPHSSELHSRRCYSGNGSRNNARSCPRLGECRTMEELVRTVHDHLDVMSPRDAAAFWTSASKFLAGRDRGARRGQEQLYNQIAEILRHTLERIGSAGYRDLAQTALGIARIVKEVDGKRLPTGSLQQSLYDLLVGNAGMNKEFVFNKLAAVAVPILHEFDERSLSNFIYAFGLAECVLKFDDGSTLFDVLANAAVLQLKEFIAQGLSNVLWAYGNVKVANPALFEAAGDTIFAKDNLDEFKPQALSNTVRAYATLKQAHPMLFQKVANHIVALDNLHEFNPQALSIIAWAYATLKESHPKLFKKVANHVIALNSLDRFNAQDCSNTVWAYATLKEAHPKLFEKVANHIIALQHLYGFNAQALSNTLWAYATADESNPKLFRRVADHVVALDNLDRFNAQDCSNTVWAYATAGESSPRLFEKISDAALKQQHLFNSQEVANFLWACAANGQIDMQMFKSWEPVAASLVSTFNEQGLANVAWAYAVANEPAPTLFNEDFINAISLKEDKFGLENLRQLHQWQLWQEEIQSDLRLPQSLKEQCHNSFVSKEPRPSALQRDVVSVLHSLGLEPEEEALTKAGYRIDAVIEAGGKKVAVEVDGPFHFLGSKPTGSTILKHRQVPALEGMQLLSVPYWEWNKLGKDGNAKQQYLRSLLSLA